MAALRASEREQRDLRRNPKAHRSADGAEPAIHIESGKRRLRLAGYRGVIGCAVVYVFDGANPVRGHGQRSEVRPGDVIGDEARGAQTMVQDFDLDLPAMGVTGERKLDAQLSGA